MRARATAGRGKASRTAPAQPRPVPAAHHTRVLAAAEKRALDLEDRLVEILTPILEHAGDVAARNFEARATSHRGVASGIRQTFPLLASAASSASTMIAVKPAPAQAAMLAEPGGDPPENLHVTLAYLGETEGELAEVADALAGVPGAHAPLEGTVGGVGCFADNGKGHPAILLPSVPGLLELRHQVTEALTRHGLDYSRGYGFVPHMTLAYRQDGPRTPDVALAGQPLSFDDLWVVRGDVETIQLPLTGALPLTAAGDPWEALTRADQEVFAAEQADVLARIAEVAERHRPDGGYGDAWWKAADATVLWFSADWTTNEEVEAAVADFLEIDGVEWVEDCAECGAPTGPGWTRAYPAGRASLEAAAGDPPFCLPADLRGRTDPVRQAVVETMMRAGIEGAGIDFQVVNPLAGKILAQSGSQIVGIAETTQLDVMKTIRAAYQEGYSIPDTSRAIRAAMNEAAPWRARLIARTELAGAVNGASLASTQVVEQATGARYLKSWMTAPGAPHPRHENYEGLDGQTVALSEPFDVGGAELMFPGDPNGPVEEVANCRCSMKYIEADDASLEAGATLSSAPQAEPREAEPSRAGPCQVDREAVRLELSEVMTSLTAAGLADWSSPAPEEILPVHCEGPILPLPSTLEPEADLGAPERTSAVGDTLSVGAGPPVPAATVAKIRELGLDTWPASKGPAALAIFGDAKDTEALYFNKATKLWDQQRAILHRRIIDSQLEGKVAGDGPLHAYFTAGGGASGKSGLRFDLDGRLVGTDQLGERADTVLVDPDRIKKMLPEFTDLVDVGDPYAAQGVHEESSYLAKQVVEEAKRRHLNVVLDSTGSSGSFPEKIAAMQKAGYDTQVSMMSIPTNEAIVRAMARGSKSGRFVAITPLKDAHRGASAELRKWMGDPSVDKWRLYDNSGPSESLVAEGGGGRPPHVYDQQKLDEILAKGDEPRANMDGSSPMQAGVQDGPALPPLDSLPLPDDGYLAGLQTESRRLGKQVAAARYQLKTEVDLERRAKLEARMAAWEKRRDELRALMDDPDPKGELRRLTKQIANARFEIKNGRGNERLESRLRALELRRTQVRAILGSSVRDVVEKQEVTRVAEAAAATPRQAAAASDDRIKVAGEVVHPTYSWQANSASWLRGKVLKDGPDGYLRLPRGQFSRGAGGLYEMGESIAFTDAGGSGVVIRVELPSGATENDAKLYASSAQRDFTASYAATPDWMQGRLEQVVLARGDNPDDAYWRKTYKNFTTSAATGGNGTITFWRNGRPNIQSTFDHELGHIVGKDGGPKMTGSWRMAQKQDLAVGLERAGEEVYGLTSGGGGRNFIVGGKAVSEYGANSLSEDWAESIRLYLLDQRNGSMGTYVKADGFVAPARFADIYPGRARLIEKWLRGGKSAAEDASTSTAPLEPMVAEEAATMLIDAANASEPATSTTLQGIAQDTGGEMVGFDFRLKSESSLTRKLNADLETLRLTEPGATVEDVAGKINDALRYTLQFEPGDYADGVTTALERLRAGGYRALKIKNYWEGEDYKGINAVFVSPDGQRFELQFHTPESFSAKNGPLHTLYEEFRVSTDPVERRRLWKEMAQINAETETPPGSLTIGQPERHAPPS